VLALALALGATSLGVPASSAAPAPQPATRLDTRDVPNDAGRAIELSLTASPDDRPGLGIVTQYYLERSETVDGPWTVVDSAAAGVTHVTDQSVRRNTGYYYRVITVGPGGSTPAGSLTGPAIAKSEWINSTRWSVFAFTALFFAFVLFYIYSAQMGRRPFVRRIPGIDAIEEAIGRATEMGRPVLFVPGVQDIDDIQTVAGLVILESVARLTAKYETPVLVPVSYPIPFTIAQ